MRIHYCARGFIHCLSLLEDSTNSSKNFDERRAEEILLINQIKIVLYMCKSKFDFNISAIGLSKTRTFPYYLTMSYPCLLSLYILQNSKYLKFVFEISIYRPFKAL